MYGGSAFVLAAAVAGIASADTITFSGADVSTEGIAAFSGSMNWSYSGGGSGTLVVNLSNNSPLANGGYLTGFAFNVVPGAFSLSLCGAPSAAWQTLQNVSGSPFGTFDWGAALGGDLLGGGGNPSAGLAAGNSATFTFCVDGSDSLLAGLSAASFFDGDCTCEPGEDNHYPLIARFRGFNNGMSDKVVACPPSVVPVPMPVALAAAGLLGVGFMRRRLK
ncbi:MAG: hypothetical protein LW636_01865 [Planctomycetaceae bacterium]|jgi:hypothetical protein|nr:hypothetical protein [Planctomycetaceae bacterium]